MDKKALPNILFIMVDQHRFDCMGAYGNTDIETPHLDQLAQDGVVYDNHFCNAPVCTPSRYSTLTGLYPHQHMGWTNRCTIQPGLETYPNMLKRAGYSTKAIGKMHLTPTYQDVGFEQMELAEQNGDGRYEDDYHRYLRSLDLIDYVDLLDQVGEYRAQAPEHYWNTRGAMVSDLPEEHHSTAWIGRKGLEAIDQWGEGANLLFVSFIKPHHPFDPPAPWHEMYNPDELHLLPGWTENCLPRDLKKHPGFFPHEHFTEQQLRLCMAYYYASISHIDHYVGKMMQLLKSKGLFEDTLIIYTSDHGEYMGYHHLLLKQNYMYEPLVKVPLIIKYPDRSAFAAGARCSDLTSGIDIGVTLAAIVGEKPGIDMKGYDISAAINGRDYVFAENMKGEQYMVRSRSHKLIFCRDDSQSLFFDLMNDPLEMDNLYTDPQHQDRIKEHKAALHQMILFDAPAPVFLYEGADQIEVLAGTSVETPSGSSSEQSKRLFADWVQEKMMGRREP
jgi:arylsulfatase